MVIVLAHFTDQCFLDGQYYQIALRKSYALHISTGNLPETSAEKVQVLGTCGLLDIVKATGSSCHVGNI